MKSIVKAVMVVAAVVATGLVAGCGGGGGDGATAASGAATPSAGAPASAPPASAVDGAALYAANCATCHGPLATSAKKGATVSQIGVRMYTTPYATRALTNAEIQAIASVLAATTAPPVTPPTTTVDGAALYAANCASCHGALATSAKKGATAAQIGVRMFTTPYATRTLTAAEIQAIAGALATTTPPVTPPVTPPTTTVDGAALYAANCASCHGPLATSAKLGATAAQIGVRMFTTPYATRTLTAAEIQAIAGALVSTTPPPVTPPAATCGSCHAIPPATGKHAFHSSRATCATCHGAGYSTTTVNTATHNNGVKNLATTIGWNTTSRSCSNSCHGSKSW